MRAGAGLSPGGASVPRVVLDTNAIVAARWRPGGSASRLVDLCIAGRVRCLVSRAVRREHEYIARKVRPTPAFLARLARLHETARCVENPPEVRVSEDPADDAFLACALGGGAEAVISSDRHLRVLDGYEGVRVCSAGAFLASHPELAVPGAG